MTLQEKNRDLLLARGEKIVHGKSRKYIVMTDSRLGHGGWFWYLGRAGAVRVGKTIADSFSTRIVP